MLLTKWWFVVRTVCKDQSDQVGHHLWLGVVLSLLSLWETWWFSASVHFHVIRAIAEIIGMFSTDLRPWMKTSNACDDPWKACCICSSRPRTKSAGKYYQLYKLLLTGVCIRISWFLFAKRWWPSVILFQIVTQQKTLFEGVYLCSGALVNTYTVIIIYEAFSKTRGCACELLACSPNFCFS